MLRRVLLLTLSALTLATGKELSAQDFTSQVAADQEVWLVEFYSAMCGSCQEFAPVWASIESTVETIKTGKLNIDIPANLDLAQRLGVLDEGIPNIQLFASKAKRVTIMSGDLLSKKEILSSVHKQVKGLDKSPSGIFIREFS